MFRLHGSLLDFGAEAWAGRCRVDCDQALIRIPSRLFRNGTAGSDLNSAAWRLMEVCYNLPDFRCPMLAAERRSGNQTFAHRQSADDDGVETNRSDEARRDINSVRTGDRAGG